MHRTNDSVRKLLECVTLEGVMEHEEAFQAIADANGGNRASGTPGYDASVEYVADRMTAAGYDVTLQAFDFFAFEEAGPSELEQISAQRGHLRRGHRLRCHDPVRAW